MSQNISSVAIANKRKTLMLEKTLSRKTGIFMFDTETTGLDPRKNSICSFAGVGMMGSPLLRNNFMTTLLCDPEQPIPEEAAKVNGFFRDANEAYPSDKNLYGLPAFRENTKLIRNVMSGYIPASHNAVFDMGFLLCHLDMNVMDIIRSFPFVICTKQSFARIQGKPVSFDYVPGTSLDKLCDHLGVDRSARDTGHEAGIDAYLAAECLIKMYNQNHQDVVVLSVIDIALYYGLITDEEAKTLHDEVSVFFN